MNVRFTETALREIDEILSYVATHNLSAAQEVAEAIRATIARALARPARVPKGHEHLDAELKDWRP